MGERSKFLGQTAEPRQAGKALRTNPLGQVHVPAVDTVTLLGEGFCQAAAGRSPDHQAESAWLVSRLVSWE